jgi:glycosyltransferase involved in cell wall biosynthesis
VTASRGGPARPAPGVRVILDVRPLQAPDRAPATAAYLDALLAAFDAAPLAGESFAFLLQSDLDDPTERFTNLDVAARRMLPPTRLLRSGALTVDPFLVGGASIGAAWRADRHGAAGAVYHAAGGTVPLFSRVPTVVTLLDLAPWELPGAFQRGTTVRFGQRLRAQLLREAAAVVVGTEVVATAARRLLRLSRDRLHVVPLAAREAFRRPTQRPSDAESEPETPRAERPAADHRAERDRLGLPERYLVYSGRYDARHDLTTLLRALAELAAAPRPTGLSESAAWPPRVLLVGASPDDRAALARAAAREGAGDALAYAPALEPARLASLVAGARAALLPVLSEAAGFAAIEAVAAGTPVIASAVGALPELVGAAGILVEPRDVGRLAVAIATAWADDRVHDRLAKAARTKANADPRTWADVAWDMRAIYAGAAIQREKRSA